MFPRSGTSIGRDIARMHYWLQQMDLRIGRVRDRGAMQPTEKGSAVPSIAWSQLFASYITLCIVVWQSCRGNLCSGGGVS